MVCKLERLAEDATEIWHVEPLLPSEGVEDGMIFDANVRSVQWLSVTQEANGYTVYIYRTTVYAEPHAKGICEDAALSPTGFGGFYGSSKFFAEKILEYYADTGLQVTILRPSSIYGVGLSPSKLVARYHELAMRDEDILLKPPFDQFFNLVFAGDVAGLLLNVSQQNIAGVFNIAGYNHSIREIAQTCIDVTGSGSHKP